MNANLSRPCDEDVIHRMALALASETSTAAFFRQLWCRKKFKKFMIGRFASRR